MTQRRKSIWAGAIAGALLAIMFTAGVQAQAAQVREEFHNTYPLATSGRISLGNISGNVTITAWDRNEVKVDAVKTASTKEALDEAKIVVNTQPDSVAIKTEYPNKSSWGRHNNSASVDYTITVPRNARLGTISVVSGNVTIEGVTGDVHADSVSGNLVAKGLSGRSNISTVSGTIDVSFARLQSDAELKAVNGSLTVTIPSDAKAEVSAQTVSGSITNEFGLPVEGHIVGHELRGTLGTGGPKLALSSVSGSISLRHAADGKPMSKATSKLPSNEHGNHETTL
jgi:DUF4097 and DUF4098 domain-containing protein YvlB